MKKDEKVVYNLIKRNPIITNVAHDWFEVGHFNEFRYKTQVSFDTISKKEYDFLTKADKRQIIKSYKIPVKVSNLWKQETEDQEFKHGAFLATLGCYVVFLAVWLLKVV